MADRTPIVGADVIAAPDYFLDAPVDARIVEMRRLLDTMADQSAAEALSALRDAFPNAPLAERVRALKYSRH